MKIKNLLIKNFKSIKDMNLECKRVNIFIGKPNVGKSNILEALSIFNLPIATNQRIELGESVRYANLKNFFYDNHFNENIKIYIDNQFCGIRYIPRIEKLQILTFNEKSWIENLLLNNFDEQYKILQSYNFDRNLEYFDYKKGKDFGNDIEIGEKYKTKIRPYIYDKKLKFDERETKYLLPPFGKNLFSIIQNKSELSDELAEYFSEYGLQWVYDYEENLYFIQKQIKNTIYKYPFNSISDTLQRMIFYTTAIETNKDCILLFEEPETNSFPPYTRDLAYKIASNKENQFFISTHSPYLLLNLIENTPNDELNVFVTYYENYETKVKSLSAEEIRTLLDDSVDIFFNLDKYIKSE